MSLNRREIDFILSEWQLDGARVQEVYQPSIQSLYMELYLHGSVHRMHVYLSQGAVRLHLSEKKCAKPKKPQRFQQLLQSKIVGMYVKGISHVNDNRIVKMHLVRMVKDDTTPIERYLYFKLWSNNVNIVYTNAQNTIIDLLYRSPMQQLMPKKCFILPQGAPSNALSATTVREWSGTSFNAYVESYYQKRHSRSIQQEVLKKATVTLEKRILYLHNTCINLEVQLKSEDKSDLYTKYGNAILQHAHEIMQGDAHLEVADVSGKGTIRIVLNAEAGAAKNAQHYFEKAKKARGARENTQARYEACMKELHMVQKLQSLLPETSLRENDVNYDNEDLLVPEHVLEYVRQHEGISRSQIGGKTEQRRGILLHKDNFVIAIGRNAGESDALLRTYARGEDIWMHVLGMKGGFVFLRCPRMSTKTKSDKTKSKRSTKSAPLELLLECARLAALFSKAKNSARVDVMYTKVKHLRRVKGSIAQVLPAHTKTLHVDVDRARTQAFVSMYEVS